MKKYILSFALLVFLYTQTKAQIIIQALNQVVPCCSNPDSACSNVDSIDIENNGIYNTLIYSGYSGSNYFFGMRPLDTKINISYSPVDSGMAFTSFNEDGGQIALTIALCSWSDLWIPGTGIKYQGFRRINAPNDTTYGWIELNFIGQQNICNDTVLVIELGYDTIPNLPLLAGQTFITGINEIKNIKESFSLSPNPATNQLTIHTTSFHNEAVMVSVLNVMGQEASPPTPLQGERGDAVIDIGGLSAGIYFLQMKWKGGSVVKMFVKE